MTTMPHVEQSAGSLPVCLQPLAAPSMHDALHGLCQPLTALLFLLEIGRMQHRPALWRESLDRASVECNRAIGLLERVRQIAGDEALPQQRVGAER